MGLAREEFPMLKSVGSDKSVAIRGDGKIYAKGLEEPISLAGRVDLNLRQKGQVIGLGYTFMTKKVFFTLNGREVYQMSLPDALLDAEKLYPTFSIGGLKDRIQINFGQGRTQFMFDLNQKISVSPIWCQYKFANRFCLSVAIL